MKITTLTVGALETNCYVLESDGVCAVIDPGADERKIADAIKGKEVRYILLTHGHFDHILACAAIKKLTGAKILISEKDACLLSEKSVAKYRVLGWLSGEYEEIKPDGFLNEGDELFVGNAKIKVMETPGHSEGSCSFLCADKLFSGDTLFFESFGRCDLDGGDMNKIIKSVQKLLSLDAEIKVFPGHGDTTSIKHERIFNPLAGKI